MEISKHLGFYPQNNYSKTEPYFDLMDGYFCSNCPPHLNYLYLEDAEALSNLLSVDLKNIHYYQISKTERLQLLNNLIRFYSFHVPNFKEIKSLSVLQTTLS
jgi:DNA repair protein RecO (recombination protein O)